MYHGQTSIGRDKAIQMYNEKWWVGKTSKEIATFQLQTAELCTDWGVFQQAVEDAVGAPVWTHEFVNPEVLLARIK